MSTPLQQGNTVSIVLNGEARRIARGETISGLLLSLGLDPARVAVELERVIVRAPEWGATQVPEGANVEVVQFVGGG